MVFDNWIIVISPKDAEIADVEAWLKVKIQKLKQHHIDSRYKIRKCWCFILSQASTSAITASFGDMTMIQLSKTIYFNQRIQMWYYFWRAPTSARPARHVRYCINVYFGHFSEYMLLHEHCARAKFWRAPIDTKSKTASFMYLQYVHIFKTRGAESIWSFVNVATESRFVATFQKYPEATFKEILYFSNLKSKGFP